MASRDLSSFRLLSFDCYGTLIDWERGILAALAPVFESRAIHADDEELLEAFGRIEPEVQADEPGLAYRGILERVLAELGEDFGFPVSQEECQAFAASVADWPAFPDSGAALARLAERYDLAILSNVDDDLFAGSAQRLGVDFTHVFTAQRIGSYKPDPRNFEYLIEHAGVPEQAILHVAQSRFHDVAPARALGLTTVWVNRRGDAGSGGATAPSDAVPHLEVPDMATLAHLACG